MVERKQREQAAGPHCNRLGTAMIAALAGLGSIVASGCLQINEGHCVANGGDAHCNVGVATMCVMSEGEEPESSRNGCIEPGPNDSVPTGFVHVKYGFATTFADFEGVLMAGRQCSGDRTVLRSAFATLFENVVRLLDGRHRTRRSSIPLKSEVDEFTKVVYNWINDNCDVFLDTETSTSTGTDTTATTESSSDSTTSEPPSCTVETQEEDCPTATPFCEPDDKLCVSCAGMPNPNAACVSLFPTTPLCFEIEEECVECTALQTALCDAQLLMCDPVSNTCAPCTAHEQCSSGACDIFVGTCFDPAAVVEMGGAGQPDTIAAGLEELEALWPDVLGERRGVLVLQGMVDFNETVTIQDGSVIDTDAQAIAFIAAAAAESPSWLYTAVMPEAPTLSVRGATTRAYLDGIVLRNNLGTSNGWGVRCDNARVDVRRSQVVANEGGGIEALGQCELRVENSFVGGDVNDRDAVSITDADVEATILYSTLGAGFGAAAALHCTAMAEVEVRSSLLVARTTDPAVMCSSAELTSSATEAGGLGDMSLSWFSNFATGDFHLSGSAPSGIVVAEWQLDDPLTDIDGDPRVTAEGMLDHAGADVP